MEKYSNKYFHREKNDEMSFEYIKKLKKMCGELTKVCTKMGN